MVVIEQIWAIPSRGGVAVQVTWHGQNGSPNWSPDGRQIAFRSTRDGHWNIWVIPAPGTTAIEQESWGSIKGKYHWK